MRVPLSWLAAHVDGLPTDVDAVGEAFVRVGLEVEDIHRGPARTGLRARWWPAGSWRSRS